MSRPGNPSRRRFLRASAAAVLAGMVPGSAVTRAHRVVETWQVGCYTRPWDRYDYRVALDGIAEAGFPYVGIMTHKGKTWVMITPRTTRRDAEQIGEEVKSRGLKTISVYGDFSVRETATRAVEDLRHLIELAVACGSPGLLLGGTSDERQYDAYYRTIAECCDFAATLGVGLSIKPHGGLNATGAQCRKAIERVGHRNFGLWYDPGNVFYYSQGRRDPAIDAAAVDGLVVGMSVKDFLPPGDVNVTPGDGRVRFPEVLARLARGGFTAGPLIVECLEPGDVAHVTAQARRARERIEGWLRALTAAVPGT
jgi:sugar phosphate isomerase/epimerase